MENFFANDSNGQEHFHEFGEFCFDSTKRTLWRNGSLVYLRPKTADLLTALLERRGQLLERGELIQKVWKDTIVEEGNLSYTVSELRKVLGKNRDGEHFIQTIPRRGYRFADNPPHADEIELIYERHSQTVVEEIHISDSPAGAATRVSVGRYPFERAVIALIGIAAITAITVGMMKWSVGSDAAGSAGVKSLAVVPFRTIESDQTTHRGLGLADVIITRLRGQKEITVRPTNAVMNLEYRDFDLSEIGKQLQVDAILEGMIFQTGSTVRVTARLTRVSDGATLWTGLFEKPSTEESLIENDLVLQLVDALALSSERTSARPYTTNPDAYQLYVSGRYEWNKRSLHSLQDAKRLFRDAIAVDPTFALAYVGLADALVLGYSETPELNSLIAKAIELDPDLGEAYATLGFMQTIHRWDWTQAEVSFRKAIELKPGYPTAHHWYAILLGIQGRTEEARAEMRSALEINPASYNFLADLGQIYYFERNYPLAEEYCNRALAIYPDFSFSHGYLEQVYLVTGKYDAAIDEMVAARVSNLVPSTGSVVTKLPNEFNAEYYRRDYESGGVKGLVERYIAEDRKSAVAMQNPNTHYRHALLYSLIGDREHALESLERALEGRAFLVAWVKADPLFDGLRSEPRYQEILRKMGLSS